MFGPFALLKLQRMEGLAGGECNYFLFSCFIFGFVNWHLPHCTVSLREGHVSISTTHCVPLCILNEIQNRCSLGFHPLKAVTCLGGVSPPPPAHYCPARRKGKMLSSIAVLCLYIVKTLRRILHTNELPADNICF